MWQAEEAEAAGQLARQVRYVLLQQHTTSHVQQSLPVRLSCADVRGIEQHSLATAGHYLKRMIASDVWSWAQTMSLTPSSMAFACSKASIRQCCAGPRTWCGIIGSAKPTYENSDGALVSAWRAQTGVALELLARMRAVMACRLMQCEFAASALASHVPHQRALCHLCARPCP